MLCDNCLTIMRGKVFDRSRRHATELRAYSARRDQVITYASIVIDPTLTNPKAITSAIAHELGHIFGLHEAYNHDPQYSAGSISCKDDTAASVMDSVITSTGRTVNGCDGVSPTARDIGLVQALYSLAPPAAPTTIFQAGPDIAVRFRDDNAAEEGYGVIVERWSGSGWIFTDSRFLTNSIAPCSTVPCGQDRTVYYRKPDGPLNDGDRRPRAAPW